MYDMYPEWGPAPAPRPDDPTEPHRPAGSVLTSVQAGPDLRDNGGQRPDDN